MAPPPPRSRRCLHLLQVLAAVGALLVLLLSGRADIFQSPPGRLPSLSVLLPAGGALGRGALKRGTQGCIGGADWFEVRRQALGPLREPTIDMSPAQRAANARVLVISSDTRPLARSWANRTYSSLSMALNRQYAQAHGYDFAFVRTFASSQPAGQFSAERDAACFHPAFGIWRVHNWCKVLTLWAAARALEGGGGGGSGSGSSSSSSSSSSGAPRRPLYDLVVYLDSDAIMQDLGSDVADTWAPSLGGIVFGKPFCGGAPGPTSLSPCATPNGTGPLFVFYSDNVPGEPASPNLGYFAMRNVPRTMAMLRDWWDFVDPVEGHKYAYYAFHEQTGMWKLMQGAWAGGVTVTGTRWAPDDLAKMVRHINSEEARYTHPRDFRVEKFSQHAQGRYLAGAAYEEAIADTIESCDAVDLDVMELVGDMDAFKGPWVRGP